MLLFGRKLTAQEALKVGFVNEVFPSDTFDADAKRRVEAIASLPAQVRFR